MDEQAFDALYAETFGRLVWQVYAMCGDLGEAQDCVQEAFIRAWDHRRKLDRAGSPEAWVRTTARRLAVSRWRHFGRRNAGQIVGEPATPSLEDVSAERLALVQALKKLPDAQREAIVLFHFADLSVDDVAREVNAPVGTVKARLARGRAALAEILRPTRQEV